MGASTAEALENASADRLVLVLLPRAHQYETGLVSP